MTIEIVSDYGTGDENIPNAAETEQLLAKGQMSLSLTNSTNDSRPAIASGSWVEVDGEVYKSDSETSISLTDPYTSTEIYVDTIWVLVGIVDTELNAFFTNTKPVWSDAKQGWYGTGSYTEYRYIAWMQYERGLYLGKRIIIGNNDKLYGSVFDYDRQWGSNTATFSNRVYSSPIYGNGRYVAVGRVFGGSDQKYIYSLNGVTWTEGDMPDSGQWEKVTYGNNIYVACGYSVVSPLVRKPEIATSPDGQTWTVQTIAGDTILYDITYAEDISLFVAVGVYTGTARSIYSSPDGIIWTERETTYGGRGIVYGNGKFVVVTGTQTVLTSTNGITWSTHTAPSNNNWQYVTYGNGVYVATADSGTNRIMYSTNGSTWAEVSGASATHQAVTFANGLYIAFKGSNLSVSNDGTNWDYSTYTNPATFGNSQANYGNNEYWTSGTTGTTAYIYSSKHGLY